MPRTYSPMRNSAEHFPTKSVTAVTFGVVSLQVLAHLKPWVVFFLSFEGSLYILGTSPLSKV